MSKHTPGPWHLEKSIGTGNVDCGWHVEPEVIDYKYRGMVASLSDAEHIEGITKAERDANARLIAAAPELLDCCVRALAALDSLRAAIAKATGESA